jgi:hypothetical protein
MSFINFLQRPNPSKNDEQEGSGLDPDILSDNNQEPKSKGGFSFTLFGTVAFGALGLATLTNWLVDPLWYRSGNQITGQNFAFNERISKTNQFLRKDLQQYDCLILGSSRVTALNVSEFQNNNCFNYSFKGGWAEDFINVANYVKDKGLSPAIIYIGVDEFNFVEKTENPNKPQDFSANQTRSPFHAYVSSNVFLFSLMTLGGVSPDASNYYDRNFESREFPDSPRYQPSFYPPEPPQECDLTRVELYEEIRNIFPDARIVGYVPPRASWEVVNETYNRKIMSCVLDGFHQVSTIYDDMYDFSVPSEMTMEPSNTYDGSHFTVEVNNQIADILENRADNIGLKVDKFTIDSYKTAYIERLEEFLSRENVSLEDLANP